MSRIVGFFFSNLKNSLNLSKFSLYLATAFFLPEKKKKRRKNLKQLRIQYQPH